LPTLKPNTIDLVRDDTTSSSSTAKSTNNNRGSSTDLRHDSSIKSIVKETDNVRLAAERELIQTERDAIIENAEIVKYKILVEIAKRVGAMDAIPVIDENLKEEAKMANWLIANTPKC
jgi:ferritin-like metal-binding protein YciE